MTKELDQLHILHRVLKLFLRNTRRVFTLLGWLCTGQFSRAGQGLLPYYQQYVPPRVKKMVPRRLREALVDRLARQPEHTQLAAAGAAARSRSHDGLLYLTGYGPISKVLDYYSLTPDPLLQQDSICVHLHLFHTDLADHFADLLGRLSHRHTLLISVPEDQDASRWQRHFSERVEYATQVIVKNVPNRGRDQLPWLVTFADEIQKHTIFCHMHSKKSGHADFLRDWRPFLEHSMFGSQHLINQILGLFLENPSLGLIYPPYFERVRNQPAWGRNKEQFASLYRRLTFKPLAEECPHFPAGSFFWARTSVLRPLFDLGLTVEDFPAEAGQIDGTLPHAIERIVGVLPDIVGMGKACVAVKGSYGLAASEGGRQPDARDFSGPDLAASRLTTKSASQPPETLLETADPNCEWYTTGACPHMVGVPSVLLCGHVAGHELFGGEFSLMDILAGLRANGLNVYVTLPSADNAAYIRELTQQSCGVYILPYRLWQKNVQVSEPVVASFARVLCRHEIDVVHANTIMLREPLEAARRLGIASIIHAREIITHDEYIANAIGLAPDEIVRQVLARSDYIVANSKATAACYDKGARTMVLPNTIDIGEFDIVNDIDPGQIRVGLISSNILKKGILDFVEVAEKLRDRAPNLRFVLIGPENEYTAVMHRRQQRQGLYQNLTIAGYVEPADAVSKVNIVVSLSHFAESFGRTVLEAMAARRPVVAYEWGAIPELVVHGETGYLAPHKDLSQVALYLEQLSREPSLIAEMGEAARRIAVSGYSKQTFAESLRKSYSTILGYSLGKTDESLQPSPQSTATASVSVVIPNYNYERHLRERLRSILDQTLRPVEIIFLDDASTDNSVEVARRTLEQSSISFRIIRNESNAGTYRQWLKGIAEAEGDFIWIAEADDTCEPDMLATLCAAMADERVVIAYCQSKRIDENGFVTAPDNLRHTNELDPDRWRHDYRELGLREVVDWMVYRNTIPNTSACLLRKSAIAGIEERLSQARFCGDWLLYTYMLRHGDVTYVAQPLNSFRRHSGTVTASQGKTIEYLEEVVSVREHICEAFPIRSAQLQRMDLILDKDYKIQGVDKNSEHPAVRAALEAIEARIRQNRRFAFITTNDGSFDGGSEVLWREAAKRLRTRGHDVVVLIKKWDPQPPFLDDFARLGIKSCFKEEQGFESIVGFNPDLVVVSVGDQDEGIEYYGELRKRSIPYIIINQLTKEPRFWPIRNDRNARVRAGYTGAERVFFTCQNNQRVMEQRLECEIPRWTRHFNPCHTAPDAVLPFPPVSDGVSLAVPANIRFVHKGQELIVEVMKQERWKNRNITINLYGVGEDEERLRDMIKRAGLEERFVFHGRLVFVGREHEISQIWLLNHGILLASRMEGLPLMLVSAMLCGRVPIVTNIGGHSEVVEDGATGFIAADATAQALDEAMERAYRRRDEWEGIGLRARKGMLEYLPQDPVGDAADKILEVVGLEASDLV